MPKVNYLPVFSSQSSNCSDNGDNAPTQSQDEHLDTQTDVQVLAENVSDYDYDDNHSHSSWMMKILIVMTVTISMAIP